MTDSTKKLKLIDKLIKINLVLVSLALLATVCSTVFYLSQREEYLIRHPGMLHGVKLLKIKLTKQNRRYYEKDILKARRF